MSKRSADTPSTTERTWSGAGLGLDVPILHPVMSNNPRPLARRRPGRPPWTEAGFLENLAEAEVNAAPSRRIADIAAQFRDLSGQVGITPDSLRRLLRRFRRPSEIPE